MGAFPELRPFALGMIAVGAFLTLFYGVWIKRREIGRGLDTPKKRIAVYAAIGMGAGFIGGAAVLLWSGA